MKFGKIYKQKIEPPRIKESYIYILFALYPSKGTTILLCVSHVPTDPIFGPRPCNKKTYFFLFLPTDPSIGALSSRNFIKIIKNINIQW